MYEVFSICLHIFLLIFDNARTKNLFRSVCVRSKEIELEPLIKETVDLLSEAEFSKQIAILVNIDKSIKLLVDEKMKKEPVWVLFW